MKVHGPAWANSLFEDNAEFGFGMFLGVKTIREKVEMSVKEALTVNTNEALKAAIKDWLKTKKMVKVQKLQQLKCYHY